MKEAHLPVHSITLVTFKCFFNMAYTLMGNKCMLNNIYLEHALYKPVKQTRSNRFLFETLHALGRNHLKLNVT